MYYFVSCVSHVLWNRTQWCLTMARRPNVACIVILKCRLAGERVGGLMCSQYVCVPFGMLSIGVQYKSLAVIGVIITALPFFMCATWLQLPVVVGPGKIMVKCLYTIHVISQLFTHWLLQLSDSIIFCPFQQALVVLCSVKSGKGKCALTNLVSGVISPIHCCV